MIEQQFIEYVVKQLVSEPDQVKVVRTDDDATGAIGGAR